jgi:DNA-binding FadR family transcriptional regulator
VPFQPVETQRLYERVAEQIVERIQAGEIVAGQRLPAERDLAKALGVSRPVVREALIALEVAGLVEVRTGAGAFVREPPASRPSLNAGDSPSDILNARMLIEGETAALAAERASPSQVEAIAAAIEAMRRDHDAGRDWRPADLAFHVAVARAGGNSALCGVVEQLWQAQQGAVFSLLWRRVRLDQNWSATYEGHMAALQAIRSQQPERAREAMRAHLAQVLDVMTRDEFSA